MWSKADLEIFATHRGVVLADMPGRAGCEASDLDPGLEDKARDAWLVVRPSLEDALQQQGWTVTRRDPEGEWVSLELRPQ